MSKPKLLITMGCSHTEGKGCYDPDTLPSNIDSDWLDKEEYRDIILDVNNKNQDRFHELGWPNRLGKKLNYDRVLNLGFQGSGTSGQLKSFMEKYHDEYFEEYEVLLFWFLSDPSRFSLYSDGYINHKMLQQHQLISQSRLDYIKNIDIDSTLEQLFYVRCMREICENRKWNYLVFQSLSEIVSILQQLDSGDYYLEMDDIDIWKTIRRDSDYTSWCQHANEKGYEFIAQTFYHQIKKYLPHLLNQNSVKNFTWEWNGKPFDWRHKIDYNA